jgi:hypothetical protein
VIRVTKPESQDEICCLAARFDRTRDFAGLVVHPPRERRRCWCILQRQNLELVAGFNVGGGADLYARLIARHFGKRISDNPTVIVRNMPGAGSVAAANYIFNVSPRDGSEIGLARCRLAASPIRE